MATDARHESTTIGVGLLGYGFAGRTFHAPFITTTPGLSLRVVASSQPDRVTADHPAVRVVPSPVAVAHDDEVALVVIATPNDTHARLADAALRAGKHVVVDKPFTVTLGEAHALAATAASVERVLSVFQNRRWDSDFLAVSDAIATGTVGEVVELRSEIARWRPAVRNRWRERPGPGAGLWYDLGPHLVDQAVHLFGAPTAVQAALRTMRPGGLTDDWFSARLEYPRQQVTVSSTMLAADSPPRFVVRGTSGSLVKQRGDPQERRLLAGDRPGPIGWGRDDDPLLVCRDGEAVRHVPAPAGDYGQFYAAMRDAILHGSRAPVTLAEAVSVMAVIEAGIQSSHRGRTVPVQQRLST